MAPPLRLEPCPAQHAAVADTTGQAVLVEPLEQELRVPAADAREVAEARERDLAGGTALLYHEVASDLVAARADHEAVPEADEPSLSLEEARQFRVVAPDGGEAGGATALERGGPGPPSARGSTGR
jgi:hypothetical protein